MQDVLFRVGGVVLGCGVGAGWGWVTGRLFTQSLAQDITATLMGWLLGSVIAVAAEIAALIFQSQGGLGAVSAGTSEGLLFGLPLAVLLAAAARSARRRLGRVAAVPVVLGGLGALLGAVWVTMTIGWSVG